MCSNISTLSDGKSFLVAFSWNLWSDHGILNILLSLYMFGFSRICLPKWMHHLIWVNVTECRLILQTSCHDKGEKPGTGWILSIRFQMSPTLFKLPAIWQRTQIPLMGYRFWDNIAEVNYFRFWLSSVKRLIWNCFSPHE